jgi:hypothetical protein
VKQRGAGKRERERNRVLRDLDHDESFICRALLPRRGGNERDRGSHRDTNAHSSHTSKSVLKTKGFSFYC